MKFFEHFFQTDEIKKQELTKIFHEIDKSSWIQVFSACLGKMMVIQNNASECIVKGRGWNVDFTTRSLFFGEDEYKFQYIGSESTVSNTWMWGWENINQFSEECLILANEMKSKGCDWNLDSLATPQFELTDLINGHTLSIVSCGLSEENYFYYRGPHNNGAVYLAVEYAEKDVLKKANLSLFAQITMECVKQYPVDHKIFVESLLQWNKTPYKWNGDMLIAKFPQELYIGFEQKGNFYRIVSMKTK